MQHTNKIIILGQEPKNACNLNFEIVEIIDVLKRLTPLLHGAALSPKLLPLVYGQTTGIAVM